MNLNLPTVLAIESAIAGGGISLYADGKEIIHVLGDFDVPRAEELLYNVDKMLSESGVERGEIDLIAVSAGPGSFTGIRIGLATSLGLKIGLGKPMASVSALVAMAAYCELPRDVSIAIPMGRNAACLQDFQISDGSVTETGEPRSILITELVDLVTRDAGTHYVLHPKLVEATGGASNVYDSGHNIAGMVARFCSLHPNATTEPLFISKSL